MFGFGKKRSVDLILSPDPKDNKPPEKEDKDIQIDMSQKVALGPAATAEDEKNYSSGSIIGNPSSYYDIAQNIGTRQETPNDNNLKNSEEILVPFIPDGPLTEDISSNSDSSEMTKLHRKIEELNDKIYLLERKIERLDGQRNY